MAPLTSAVPDKIEILAAIETVLTWDLDGPDRPAVNVALGFVQEFTAYGRIVADDLRTQCLSIPANSQAGRGTQAILSEAARRLHLSPPARTPQGAGHRAQNIARLVKGLLRAMGEVGEEQARARRRHTTTKGTR
ncbi:DUF6415 family natural product biosynthesis protein [Streptomyces albidoflavus]|uniref:DUF6415 family natural product biosynthesis protein n=1 Tax=Streptomyces albidoflavus TaxID=1886 RepID=UPI002119EA32|nr:DUF6415 family natural product biosynthesis protein [Streptomyces albidoflavus]